MRRKSRRGRVRDIGLMAGVFLGAVMSTAMAGDIADVAQLPADEVSARIASDFAAVGRYREGMRSALEAMRADPVLFPPASLRDPRVLTVEQKGEVLATWKGSLDYVLALDSIGGFHATFDRIADKDLRNQSFLVRYAAFVAEYAFAMEFIEIVERDPSFHTLLNEPLGDLGLPQGTYADFKFRFLNVARATEFAALTAVQRLRRASAPSGVQAGMDEDKRIIWRMGSGTGPLLTGKNGLKIVKDAGFSAGFPVQAGISEWMGDTKVYRKGSNLITLEQIAAVAEELEPGDILLERREWHLSNIGLPGFWPHAAVYVGTPDIRRTYFSEDAVVGDWVRAQGRADGDLEGLLRDRFPETYDAALAPLEDSYMPVVIEALGEGVIFTTLEHSAHADSLAVLRPRLSKKDKAVALLRMFGYVGKPYDFNFDFVSDAAMVCTEVVYKAYQPGPDGAGLNLPLTKTMGRMVTPANEIARMFDAEFGKKEQQLDLIHFLDGVERKDAAVEGDLVTFRESWKRPKWHILVQRER